MLNSRSADHLPGPHQRSVRTRVWFVAQWGPEAARASPASVPECFRTVRCGSLGEARAVALAGALALDPSMPWVAGARVSKILFPTEAAPIETDRWLYAASGWVKV